MKRVDGWIVTMDEAKFLDAVYLIGAAESVRPEPEAKSCFLEAGLKLQSLDQVNLTAAAEILLTKIQQAVKEMG